MYDFEKNFITKVLGENDWKKQKTAVALGIDRSNLFKKMRKFGIDK